MDASLFLFFFLKGLCTDLFRCSPSLLVIACIARAILFLCFDHECCHNTSVVTAHANHVVGFSIFAVSQVSSFDHQAFFLYIVLSAVKFSLASSSLVSQFSLMVDCDRCCNGWFADVFCITDSFSPFLVLVEFQLRVCFPFFQRP